MKILRSIIIATLVGALIFCAGFSIIYLAAGAGYKLDEAKFNRKGNVVIFYDRYGEKITAATALSDYGDGEQTINNDLLKKAFIAVEDKRFYSHGGIDVKALLRALINNIKSGSLKEGGSTITQQLIKNTHLSGEKTLARKLRELKLTIQAEKTLSKNQILNYYLNTVYFGESSYGVNAAALNYFGKSPSELNLNECAALAATVKSPAYYNPRAEGNFKRKDLVLKLMREQGLITNEQFNEFYNVKPSVIEKTSDFSRYFSHALSEALEKTNISPYGNSKLEIYTCYDGAASESLKNRLCDFADSAQASLMAKNGEIIAEFGNSALKRSPASAIKPILVYAPALENKTITLATRILNERADFSGYNPRNYGDEYGGYESVLTAIKNSLNVPAVKVLNAVGVKKAAEAAKKAGINVTDLSLASALGALGDGVSVTELCAAYSCFACGGNYYAPTYLKRVLIDGKCVFSAKNMPTRAFSAGTAELISEALNECAKSGTARALSDKQYTVCAKTGTNGDKSGNDDAVIAAYTSEHTLCIRLSALGGEKLPANVTGGYAARYASQIFDDLYCEREPSDVEKSNEIIKVKICKIAYEEGKILLADDNAPEKYTLDFSFLRGSEPKEKSTEFSKPQISDYAIRVENGIVKISAERKSFVRCKIIRISGASTELAGELFSDKYEFSDEGLNVGSYSYSLIPYYVCKNGEELYGDEINAGSVIIYDKTLSGEWWNY